MDISNSGTSQQKNSDDWQSLASAARRELARKHPDSLLDWSLAYRTIRGAPMRLIPAMQDLYRDRHAFIVVQKAAQVFVSEFLVNTALWGADTGQGQRGNALYVMPTQTQVNDFSQARLDKAIGESDYIRARVSPPPPGRSGPVRQALKKVGVGYIYLRGSDSQRQLTSVDADIVLLDEYDLMGEGVLERATKRLASSTLGWLRVASTPRRPEAGINALFVQSDQRYYALKCPGCGLAQTLDWDHNVDQKRGLVVCRHTHCRKPMDLWAAGQWEAAAPGNDRIRGYHLNRLYSPLANIPQMVFESQSTTPAALQEFKNSVLGETFVAPGGRLTLDALDRCSMDYAMPERWEARTFMGVDVGLKLHVVIRASLDDDGKRTRALFVGEVDTFEQLSAVVQRYNVEEVVIDAQPETHRAREFALAEPLAEVRLAYYNRHEPGHETVTDHGVHIFRLNRNDALDAMFRAFTDGTAELPVQARQLGGRVRDGIGEYYREMLALSRVLEQNSQGNWVARYVDAGKADHYAHAEAYCLAGLLRSPTGWSNVWGKTSRCTNCHRAYMSDGDKYYGPYPRPCPDCGTAPK